MILCCEAHNEGILHYLSFPASTISGPKPWSSDVEGRPQLIEGDVVIEGQSHIQAVVVLLSWLRSLRNKARYKKPMMQEMKLGKPDQNANL